MQHVQINKCHECKLLTFLLTIFPVTGKKKIACPVPLKLIYKKQTSLHFSREISLEPSEWKDVANTKNILMQGK